MTSSEIGPSKMEIIEVVRYKLNYCNETSISCALKKEHQYN